jgi:hypothetical protein
MAAIPVVISGVLYDKVNKTSQNVHLVGVASIAGLSVGGGPMPGGEPLPPLDLGIWEDPGGYNPEHPSEPVPPDQPPESGPTAKLKAVWTEDDGWTVVVVVKPGSGQTVPTPSRRK